MPAASQPEEMREGQTRHRHRSETTYQANAAAAKVLTGSFT